MFFFLFIDSGMNNVLLQNNQSRLHHQLLLKFINIPERHLLDTLFHDSQTL